MEISRGLSFSSLRENFETIMQVVREFMRGEDLVVEGVFIRLLHSVRATSLTYILW